VVPGTTTVGALQIPRGARWFPGSPPTNSHTHNRFSLFSLLYIPGDRTVCSDHRPARAGGFERPWLRFLDFIQKIEVQLVQSLVQLVRIFFDKSDTIYFVHAVRTVKSSIYFGLRHSMRFLTLPSTKQHLQRPDP
jgi:hypothetical protein